MESVKFDKSASLYTREPTHHLQLQPKYSNESQNRGTLGEKINLKFFRVNGQVTNTYLVIFFFNVLYVHNFFGN